MLRECESFTLALAQAADDDLEIVMRTDAEGGGRIGVLVSRGDGVIDAREIVPEPPVTPEAWREIHLPIGPARSGDRVRLEARGGAFRDFHLWIIPAETRAAR